MPVPEFRSQWDGRENGAAMATPRDAGSDGAAAFPAFQHLHPRSQLFHGAQGVQTVLAAQEVVHFRHSVRQAAQNGGAVGDALVSGYGQYPCREGMERE